MKTIKLAIFLCFLLVSNTSHSSNVHPQTDEDFALLPPYCKAQMHAGYQNINPVDAKLWQTRLGPGFGTLHHYCWGLFDLNRASKLAELSNKNSLLSSAIAEMNYVLEHAPVQFPLLPRISYDIGKIHEQLGDSSSAMQAYFKCIKLNPKLPMPYAALSDLFKNQNNPKDALAILQQGLKFKPNSKALLKRLEKLNK